MYSKFYKITIFDFSLATKSFRSFTSKISNLPEPEHKFYNNKDEVC